MRPALQSVLLLATSWVGSITAFSANLDRTSFDSRFPVSIRQALLEKSKQINDKVISSSSTTTTTTTGGTYSTAGWSNRAGTVLTPVHLQPTGVYTVDRPFLWNTIDVGCRCTIVELPPTDRNRSVNSKPDLWVHSPVGLDGPLQAALAEIGHVKYVVSSNYEHVKFAPQWYQNYGRASAGKKAESWACPGLMEKMPEVGWAGEVPAHYRPVSWKGTNDASNQSKSDEISWDTTILQPLHIDCEVNPVTGRAFFNEVVYFHVPTKTLITTDLYWNYPAADSIPNSQWGKNDQWELAPALDGNLPWKTRFWKFVMDDVYYPIYNNVMVTDKNAYQAISRHIVETWAPETIIPAHGDLLRGKEFCENLLRKHFQLEK